MADYNINAITRRVVYTGSAGLGPYAFSFEIIDQADVGVYFNQTALTLSSDYTVTVNANGTGSVNIITGGNVPSTPTANDTIIIIGARDIERTTDFVTAGDLLASSLNEQLDSNIIFEQQIDERVDRSIKFPVYDSFTGDNVLPAAAARADKILKFDNAGNIGVESASALVGGAVVGANFVNNTFTGDGSQTAFTTTVQAGSKNNAQVYIDGVYQLKSSFSVSANTLTFTEAPPLNSQIEVIIGNAINSFASDANAVNYDQGGTGYVSRTVESKLRDFVSVKDFGATGDGVTDDTAAIQAAIDASNRVEFVKGETYNVNGTISLTEKLDIIGNGATIHQKSVSDISTFQILTGGTVEENITVNNLKFVTDGAATVGIALDIRDNVRRVIIEDCIMYGFGTGVFLDGAYNSNINRCEISDGEYGIYLDDGCHAAMMVNNNIDNSSIAGVYGQNARDISIYGGAYQNGYVGLEFSGVESLAIRDVYFEGNTYRDISLASCYTPTIQNCNSSSPVTNTSIYLDACTGNNKLDQITYASSTGSTPSHIKVNGVNGVTNITGLTPAATQATPIDVSTATNDENVNSGIEVGSNANGRYRKYDDGTLICLCTNGSDSGLSVASNATYVGSANTFPYAFTGAEEPRIVCNGRVRSAANVEIGQIQVNSHTNTTYTLQFRNNSNQTAEDIVEVSVIAIGRWK